MTSPRLLMDAARELALLAGGVALARWHDHLGRRALAVERKADGSPVSSADREVEHVAREWFSRRFPQDGVVGKELGALRPDARRVWVIDPIDGTKSFLGGVPLWGTLIDEVRTVLAKRAG